MTDGSPIDEREEPPAHERAEQSSEEDAPDDGDVPRLRRRWPGMLALVLGAAVVALDVAAYSAALREAFGTATAIVYVALGVSVVGAVLGIAAIVARAGRWWGATGAGLSVLANPVLMVWLLGALSGWTT